MIPIDPLSNAEAKSIAALYGIAVESMVHAGGGFSGARVLQVTDNSGVMFALRRTSTADATPAERYGEFVALLRDMTSHGFGLVPVPLRHQPLSARTLQTFDTPTFVSVDHSLSRILAHGSVWQMEPWLLGESVQGPPTCRQVVSTLEALAEFHKIAAACAQTRPGNQFLRVAHGDSPGILRRLSIVQELSDGLLARFTKAAANEPNPDFRDCALRLCAALEFWLPWLKKQLTDVAGVSYQLQPVIRDLWKPHVLFTEERVTGIIDLNAMATDHVGLDVTRLFRSWFGSDVEKICEATNQFCSLRLPNHHERRLLQAFDAATVLLSPVTWLRRRFVETSENGICRDVLDRLAELTKLAERFEPLSLSVTSASQIHHQR